MTELYYLTGATESQYVNMGTCLKLILSEMSTYINPPPTRNKIKYMRDSSFCPQLVKGVLKIYIWTVEA